MVESRGVTKVMVKRTPKDGGDPELVERYMPTKVYHDLEAARRINVCTFPKPTCRGREQMSVTFREIIPGSAKNLPLS